MIAANSSSFRLPVDLSAQHSIRLDQSKLKCFKSFVESKILSKSERTLTEPDKNKQASFLGTIPPALTGSGVSFSKIYFTIDQQIARHCVLQCPSLLSNSNNLPFS